MALHRHQQRELTGPQQMQAVIKAVGGTAVRVDIAASATMQFRGIPGRRYRAALPPQFATANAGVDPATCAEAAA